MSHQAASLTQWLAGWLGWAAVWLAARLADNPPASADARKHVCGRCHTVAFLAGLTAVGGG